MIVRDEAAIIERCLDAAAPLLDAVVACDTGSTDDTPDRIEAWIRRRGLPGVVVHHAWKSFGANRTCALDAARAFIDRLQWPRDDVHWLLLDADHELVIDPAFSRDAIAADAVWLEQRTDRESWWNLRLARASIDWKAVGSTHEWYEPAAVENARRLHGLWIRDHADGSSRQAKIARDIALLTDELARDPSDARAMFYLAQSYGGAGETIKALVLYRKRIAAGGFPEEVWHSMMAAGRLYASTGDVQAARAAFLEAHAADPQRAEAPYELARLLRQDGQLAAAATYASDAARKDRPQRALPVDDRVYEYGAGLELARSAAATPLHAEGFDACERLVLTRGIPDEVHDEARLLSLQYIRALTGAQFLRLAPALPPPYRACNPSIVRTESGYLVNCRGVNYEQRRLRYRPLDGDAVFRTLNVLLTMDEQFTVSAERQVVVDEPPLRRVTIQGLEDCRLFTCGDDLLCTCVTADRHPSGRIHQSLCAVRDDGTIAWHRPLVGPFDDLPQKNWLPFADDSSGVRAVYGYDPLIVVRIDRDTGAYSVDAQSATALDAARWRGSAGPLPWPDAGSPGWLLLVHEAIERDGPDGLRERVYTHRFCECDAAFTLRRVSRPFVFAHQGVEFPCGMARAHDADAVIVGLGIEDRDAYLCRIPAATIEAMLDQGVGTTLLRELAAPHAASRRLPTRAAAAPSSTLAERIERLVPTLDGWATPEKAVRLANLVLETRAAVSVELGVFGGRGTIAMAMAHQAQQHGTVAGIDPWSAEAAAEGVNDPANDAWWSAVDYEAVLGRFLDAVRRADVTRYVRVIRQRSAAAVLAFADGTVSVLHQDSNHSELISSEEVARWAPRLRSGGYWVADDCDWPTTARALQMLADLGFALVEDHGSWRVYRKP
jgi:tetratricopeptide (TPR) repeat protein